VIVELVYCNYLLLIYNLQLEVNDFHKSMLIAAASQAVGLPSDGVNTSVLFDDSK